MLQGEKFQDNDQIRLLEEKFAELIGVKHSMAVSSGRISLEAILKALDFPKEGQVILPAYTYHSVPDAIRNMGLIPVFVDIDPQDNNLDVHDVENKFTDKTVAVLATHIFGHPCDLEKLVALCDKKGVPLLEDCAHTLGGKFKSKNVGSFGKAAFFSFGATKTFNTYGGGMITCDDDQLASRIKEILDSHKKPDKNGLIKTMVSFSALHFLTKRWPFTLLLYPGLWLIDLLNFDLIKLYSGTFKKTAESISVPARYSNLQAALAISQLSRFEKDNARRRENAKALLETLRPEIKRVTPIEGAESVWYFFAVGVENRAEIAKKLFAEGIDTGKHIMENCAAISGDRTPFPETEWWYENSLQIPIYPPLTPRDMRKIAKAINEAVP